MDNVTMITLGCVGAFALIGLIVGLFKGFTNVKSWANEYVLTAVITIALGGVVEETLGGKTTGIEAVLPALVVFAVAVVLLILFTLLSRGVRAAVSRGIEKHKSYIAYRQHDDVEENDERILEAVYNKDKKSYRRYSKRKFRQSGGGWGAINRILGGITLAVKAAVILSVVACFGLMFFDLCNFGFVAETLGGIYTGEIWGFVRDYIFDFLLIGVLMICIRCGYASGISSAVWTLVVIGLVCGAGYLSWYLVFGTEVFANAAAAFDANCVSGWLASLENFEISTLDVAKWIITAGVFLVLFIVVILIAIFVPRFIEGAREGATFRVIDGILGAVVATAIVMGILLFVGAVLGTGYELDFMQPFNTYFGKGAFARYFYPDNPFLKLKIIPDLIPVDLAKWLG